MLSRSGHFQKGQGSVASRAHLAMLLWAVIVGLSFPAVGLLTEGLPPLLLTALRFAIAALALWPLLRNRPGRWPGFRGLLLYGVMGLSLAGRSEERRVGEECGGGGRAGAQNTEGWT